MNLSFFTKVIHLKRDRSEVKHNTFLQPDQSGNIRAISLKFFLHIFNCILSQQPYEILQEYDNLKQFCDLKRG